MVRRSFSRLFLPQTLWTSKQRPQNKSGVNHESWFEHRPQLFRSRTDLKPPPNQLGHHCCFFFTATWDHITQAESTRTLILSLFCLAPSHKATQSEAARSRLGIFLALAGRCTSANTAGLQGPLGEGLCEASVICQHCSYLFAVGEAVSSGSQVTGKSLLPQRVLRAHFTTYRKMMSWVCC